MDPSCCCGSNSLLGYCLLKACRDIGVTDPCPLCIIDGLDGGREHCAVGHAASDRVVEDGEALKGDHCCEHTNFDFVVWKLYAGE